jgi:hypothetical protein
VTRYLNFDRIAGTGIRSGTTRALVCQDCTIRESTPTTFL